MNQIYALHIWNFNSLTKGDIAITDLHDVIYDINSKYKKMRNFLGLFSDEQCTIAQIIIWAYHYMYAIRFLIIAPSSAK